MDDYPNYSMNPGAARHLDPPKTESAVLPPILTTITQSTATDSTAQCPIMHRPNRLLADWRVSVVSLIALWALIYIAGLSRPALLDDADTVHAEAAKEMLLRHDWVTLYVNGIR